MEVKLSVEDEEFLAKCEEEFKDRYTDKDEEYMKVFNKGPSIPPILENYKLASSNFGRQNDRRYNRRYSPYDQRGHRDNQGDRERGHRGYNDYNDSQRDSNRGHGGYNDHNNYSYKPSLRTARRRVTME
ncbi:jg23794 [Pararge aegeria aegeria]|uniref:Jg23794 protein n=1 Tax=Pararge aegeria aegeria TaxID=348720 RepID=A0A8S4SPB5_9NEOP|nr:jg23794 [Pararge aegeria aegeria]